MIDWKQVTGFDWAAGNERKSEAKHAVNRFDAEQVFFNQPLIVRHDHAHSRSETRYYALGRTDVDRLLFVAFTIRIDNIRVISARDMTRSEKRRYRS